MLCYLSFSIGSVAPVNSHLRSLCISAIACFFRPACFYGILFTRSSGFNRFVPNLFYPFFPRFSRTFANISLRIYTDCPDQASTSSPTVALSSGAKIRRVFTIR